MDWFTFIMGFGKKKKVRLAMNELFNYILRVYEVKVKSKK